MGDARILIIRTGGLGDSLLLWPAVAALRRRWPDATLELLGHRGRLGLLVGPGGADRAHEVEGSGLYHLFAQDASPPEEVRARFGAYDVIAAFSAAGDCALAENLAACGAGEVHAFLPLPPPGVHAAAHALDALARAGLATADDIDGAPLLPAPEGASERGRVRLGEAGLVPGRAALLAPGSGSPAKCWPAERFADLAGRLRRVGWQPAWCGGPDDARALAAAQAACPEALPLLRDEEPARLREALLACSLFVGNDSGPTHLAAGLGRPTLALFGPTDPAAYRPLGPRVEVLQGESGFAGLDPGLALAAARRLARPMEKGLPWAGPPG